MKIYAVADQHGYLQDVPECDLLLVAGDITPDSTDLSWFKEKWMDWRNEQPVKHVLATWGNHDPCGELQPHRPIWSPQDNTQIVIDGLVEFNGLKIWLTPRSRLFGWTKAFMTDEATMAEAYKAIPQGIDILVTHTPPYGYGDRESRPSTPLGSKALLEAIGRIKPKVVICGHIHGGFGHYTMHDGIQLYNVSQAGTSYRRHNGVEQEYMRQPVEITL